MTFGSQSLELPPQPGNRMLRLVLAVSLLFTLSLNAEARTKGVEQSCVPTGDVMRPCAYQPNFMAGVKSIKVRMHRDRPSQRPERVTESGYGREASIQPHPAGCPARAFCGCGAAVRVFGRPIRELWLAAAWFKFPRTAPAAGMVAVRRGHVFVLEAHLGGDTWQVYDANSGHRMTRVHARSIAGYAIVNPRA
jgi:hypothetical protein